MANISGDYIGMQLSIDSNDHENLSYFRYCSEGEFRLQSCQSCQLLRYPPTTACPWCGHGEAQWQAVEPKGTIYSYAEVHHAIQPEFKDHLPYLILVVELDTQQGQPKPENALRVAGDLATADGELAPPEIVASAGIGSRVRMVFKAVTDGLAVPLWTLDENTEQPSASSLWRYPES